MMPFHPSYRRLLRRYLAQVSSEDLDRHESLFSLRHQLLLERNITPEQPDRATGDDSIQETIKQATLKANAIFAPFARQWNAAHRLFLARRQLALRQGSYLQIPSTGKGWRSLLKAILNYYWAWLGTFPILLINRLRFYRNEIIAIVIVLVIVGLLVFQVWPKRPDERPPGGIEATQRQGALSRFSNAPPNF